MNIDLLNKVTEQVNKCYEKYGGIQEDMNSTAF